MSDIRWNFSNFWKSGTEHSWWNGHGICFLNHSIWFTATKLSLLSFKRVNLHIHQETLGLYLFSLTVSLVSTQECRKHWAAKISGTGDKICTSLLWSQHKVTRNGFSQHIRRRNLLGVAYYSSWCMRDTTSKLWGENQFRATSAALFSRPGMCFALSKAPAASSGLSSQEMPFPQANGPAH